MTKKPKKIPEFASEDEERAFWDRSDTSDYFDWNKAEKVSFPRLKPSTETISLRLPKGLLVNIKKLANRNDVPYQSLMKMLLSKSVRELQGAVKHKKSA